MDTLNLKQNKMAYTNKAKKRTTFSQGRFYSIDELDGSLPGNVLCSMFRKPIAGEKTPDGITHKTERDGEMSDYSMCTASFAITISILFNNPKTEEDA